MDTDGLHSNAWLRTDNSHSDVAAACSASGWPTAVSLQGADQLVSHEVEEFDTSSGCRINFELSSSESDDDHSCRDDWGTIGDGLHI